MPPPGPIITQLLALLPEALKKTVAWRQFEAGMQIRDLYPVWEASKQSVVREPAPFPTS
jgi:hypothetical protein